MTNHRALPSVQRRASPSLDLPSLALRGLYRSFRQLPSPAPPDPRTPKPEVAPAGLGAPPRGRQLNETQTSPPPGFCKQSAPPPPGTRLSLLYTLAVSQQNIVKSSPT
ncbi:hypothetical protein E2C01_052778 [Portunus trituberculatus]|uniref:Uncharacterized protein n=1 Tax=Portunus trituberculatus TaxID=210409 RepID=A0A5B7GME1_PORTR|nr:hypothetical protein [Portunus trituberculatus]